MKEQTAVEWLVEQICGDHTEQWQKEIEQARAMESKQRLKHLLLIGKVTEILGFDKVVELLKECNNEII
jgi:endonuclease YncB( thermonuclease family)